MNRYDHQAQLTFHYAREEANLLGHAQVGPEHILLGLMRAGGGGRDVLTRLGAELAWMREQFNELSPADRKGPLRGIPAVTPFAHQVMEAASQQAQALGASITSTSHILLGILSVGEPLTQRLLTMIQPDLQAIVAGARTVAPPSPAEAQGQA